jgi:hypothetical protein
VGNHGKAAGNQNLNPGYEHEYKRSLLNRSQNLDVLTNDELANLIDGLQFIYEFCRETGLGPLTVYYGQQLESYQRVQMARTEAHLKL